MPTVFASREVDATPERVWELVSRYECWPDWGVSITDVDSPGSEVAEGDRGRVRTVGGIWLPFEIDEVLEGRAWSWSVLGIPATGHEVHSRGEGCRVVFTAPGWAPFYRPVLSRALDRIAEIA